MFWKDPCPNCKASKWNSIATSTSDAGCKGKHGGFGPRHKVERQWCLACGWMAERESECGDLMRLDTGMFQIVTEPGGKPIKIKG